VYTRIDALARGVTLFAYDFDKTLARTDVESPEGITVEVAYALALDRICGTTGLLRELGGLQNRAPLELAQAVLEHDAEFLARAELIRDRKELSAGLVPEGKGVDLSRATGVELVAELITRLKLARLTGQVHYAPRQWPPLCEGVTEQIAALGDRPYGIVSSGHDFFIEKSLAVWDVRLPDFIVTDDDLRGLPLPVSQKTKPGPFPMELLLARARQAGLTVLNENVLYMGDDLDKDGGMARAARTRFVWYNPNGLPGTLWEGACEIRHFAELTSVL
jgi:hypothetical protein